MNTIEKLGLYGLIPVAAVNDSESAVPLAAALCGGGLPVAEITMRTEAGLACIRRIAEAFPEMLVGAGTVLTLDKCIQSVEAGAKFIVSPGLNDEILTWCLAHEVPVIPGVSTPTELERALSYGLRVIKFFPADVFGGVKGCASLYAPYKSMGVKFVPTGGVNEQNLADYATKPFIHAVGGSWLCRTADIDAGDFEKIRAVTEAAVRKLMGFEAAHFGLYLGSRERADAAAELFGDAFGFEVKKGKSSTFASAALEFCADGIGEKGHIAILTNNVDRAAFYLERKGLTADWSTLKKKNGQSSCLYMKDCLGGYGIHLLKKE